MASSPSSIPTWDDDGASSAVEAAVAKAHAQGMAELKAMLSDALPALVDSALQKQLAPLQQSLGVQQQDGSSPRRGGSPNGQRHDEAERGEVPRSTTPQHQAPVGCRSSSTRASSTRGSMDSSTPVEFFGGTPQSRRGSSIGNYRGERTRRISNNDLDLLPEATRKMLNGIRQTQDAEGSSMLQMGIENYEHVAGQSFTAPKQPPCPDGDGGATSVLDAAGASPTQSPTTRESAVQQLSKRLSVDTHLQRELETAGAGPSQHRPSIADAPRRGSWGRRGSTRPSVGSRRGSDQNQSRRSSTEIMGSLANDLRSLLGGGRRSSFVGNTNNSVDPLQAPFGQRGSFDTQTAEEIAAEARRAAMQTHPDDLLAGAVDHTAAANAAAEEEDDDEDDADAPVGASKKKSRRRSQSCSEAYFKSKPKQRVRRGSALEKALEQKGVEVDEEGKCRRRAGSCTGARERQNTRDMVDDEEDEIEYDENGEPVRRGSQTSLERMNICGGANPGKMSRNQEQQLEQTLMEVSRGRRGTVMPGRKRMSCSAVGAKGSDANAPATAVGRRFSFVGASNETDPEAPPPLINRLADHAYRWWRNALHDVQRYADRLPMLQADGASRALWSLVLSLLVVYTVVAVPLQVAFTDRLFSPPGAWSALNTIIDLLFTFEIIFNFRTGYWDAGMQIRGSAAVAAHYISGGDFLRDLVCYFPYAWIGYGVPESEQFNTYWRLLPLARLLRAVLRVSQTSGGRGSGSGLSRFLRFNPGIIRVAQCLWWLIISCHSVGCLWFAVSEIESVNGNANMYNKTGGVGEDDGMWGASDTLRAQPIGVQYAHAFLWGAGFVSTIMPADVVAVTLPEVVVTALATLSGMLISAAFISAMTAAMQVMDAKNLGRRQRMEEMAQYLAFKKVPHTIVAKILDFYEYYDSVFQRAGEFATLPFDLAMNLNVHLYKELLRKCPVFYNISTAAMLQLLSEMRMSVATPYQIIVRRASQTTTSISYTGGMCEYGRTLMKIRAAGCSSR